MKKLTILIFTLCALIATGCQQKKDMQETKTTDTATDSTEALVPAADATVLVLLAHPDIQKSKANAALSKAASEVAGVQVVNIYEHEVSPDVYRQAVKQAHTLVYEFPLYWLSSPHLLKQWTDEVFMAFVSEGLIEGKRLMVVTTTGSEEAAYQHDGRNKYTMEEYLRPFEGQANHAKMIWEQPLVVYGQYADGAAERLAEGCKAYKARLEQLVEK